MLLKGSPKNWQVAPTTAPLSGGDRDTQSQILLDPDVVGGKGSVKVLIHLDHLNVEVVQ